MKRDSAARGSQRPSSPPFWVALVVAMIASAYVAKYGLRLWPDRRPTFLLAGVAFVAIALLLATSGKRSMEDVDSKANGDSRGHREKRPHHGHKSERR